MVGELRLLKLIFQPEVGLESGAAGGGPFCVAVERPPPSLFVLRIGYRNSDITTGMSATYGLSIDLALHVPLLPRHPCRLRPFRHNGHSRFPLVPWDGCKRWRRYL